MGSEVENTPPVNSTTRDPNYSESQDLLLCSAWSNATNDAIVATDQDIRAFWGKAHAYWKVHRKENYPIRNPDSLMQRFSRIRTAVNKFVSYLAQVEPVSGHTENDKIALAKQMYYEFEANKNAGKKKSGKSLGFAFEHCWKVLRYDQKWLEVTTTKKLIDSRVSLDTSNPDYINLEGEEPSATPKTVERPIGKKLAKEGRIKRKGKLVYDNTPLLAKIDQSLESNAKLHEEDKAMLVESDKKMDLFLGMEKENLELKKRKLGIEESKIGMEKEMFDVNMALKEAEILKINTSTLTDLDDIEVIQLMKRRIKAKYQNIH